MRHRVRSTTPAHLVVAGTTGQHTASEHEVFKFNSCREGKRRMRRKQIRKKRWDREGRAVILMLNLPLG